MIRFVTSNDFPQISQIWQTCFGDPEDYIRLFYDHCFLLCRGLAYEENGKLAAMAFLLPGALDFRGESHPATYVYAVATLPEYRGRGVAASLMRRAAELAREEGQAALCLLPGSEDLYTYYAKLGFMIGFMKHDAGDKKQEARGKRQEFDPEVAADYRRACWDKLGYFAWTPPLLDYMAKEHLYRGGEILLEETGYLLGVRNQESGIRIRERCVCAPTDEPGGMLLSLNDHGRRWLAQTSRRGYLGLTLD